MVVLILNGMLLILDRMLCDCVDSARDFIDLDVMLSDCVESE